jgi:putative Ig domain-containing protein
MTSSPGTPTKAGSYTFTMRLTDYPGQQATQQFTLVINS